jgi:exopolyphosphatase/pppGpp-phosphohydrolase
VTRVGAVDLGSGSTRLLVADVEGDRVSAVVRRGVVTRLAGGVDERRRLCPAAVARVHEALARFRDELDALGAERTLVVATSAVRDAADGAAFLAEVGERHGFATRLLSGRGLLPELEVRAALGVAGTVAQLHALAGELTAPAVETELRRLAALPLAERRRVPRLDPARAPVIVAGTLVVAEVLRRYRLPGIAFSVRDLLDGAALEAASSG